jgi:hypothetical protein
LGKNLRERDYLEDPVMDDRISSAQMLQTARSRLQTPDVRSKTQTQALQTFGTAGLTGCRDLCAAVEDNINMHLTETVDEGIDWIHVAGGKGK